jgi:hypothetical protein
MAGPNPLIFSSSFPSADATVIGLAKLNLVDDENLVENISCKLVVKGFGWVDLVINTSLLTGPQQDLLLGMELGFPFLDYIDAFFEGELGAFKMAQSSTAAIDFKTATLTVA